MEQTGPIGPAAAAGTDHAAEIAALSSQVSELVSILYESTTETARLSAHVSDLVKQLQVQLIRIGLVQVQLDRLGQLMLRPQRAHDRIDS